MADVTFDVPMTTTKRLIIETMEHKKSGKNDINNDDDNNNSNTVNESTLLTPSIDLEKKLKSGFCNMHATKGSSATEIDDECKVFGKASCLNTD